jgi:Domain of unknown function (DUF1905)
MMGRMERTFAGEVIEWRGPALYLFVAMTPEESEDLKEAARGLIYWGQVPVHVTIGGTEFTTALFPGDGCYLMPRQATFSLVGGVTPGRASGTSHLASDQPSPASTWSASRPSRNSLTARLDLST